MIRILKINFSYGGLRCHALSGKMSPVVGETIGSIQKKSGYTQEELGELTGLSIKMISAAENGHKAMRPENTMKICECLSIVKSGTFL